MTEDEMVGWHHQLDGHGFGWTPGVGDGQGSAQTHRYTCSHTWAHTQCTHTHRCTRTHTWAHTQVHTQAWVHTVSSQPPFPDVSTSHSLPLSPFPSLHITFSSFANVYFQCSTRPTPLEPEKIILLNTEKYV